MKDLKLRGNVKTRLVEVGPFDLFWTKYYSKTLREMSIFGLIISLVLIALLNTDAHDAKFDS